MRGMKALWPDLDSLAALETGRYWTPPQSPSEPLYRPAINNGHWAGDILTNGLVLYVPLWLYSGATFPSVDAYHHKCTVTGATWGLQGRTFNGTNTRINLPSAFNTLVASHEQGTIIFWVKPTALASIGGFFSYGGADVGVASAFAFHFRAVTGTYYLSLLQRPEGGGDFTLPRGDTPISINNWYCCAVSSNGINYFMEVNGVVQTLSFTLGSDTGYWFSSSVPATPSSGLGVNFYDGDQIEWLNGVIGEGIISYPMLPLATRQYFYQATRWRYA